MRAQNAKKPLGGKMRNRSVRVSGISLVAALLSTTAHSEITQQTPFEVAQSAEPVAAASSTAIAGASGVTDASVQTQAAGALIEGVTVIGSRMKDVTPETSTAPLS